VGALPIVPNPVPDLAIGNAQVESALLGAELYVGGVVQTITSDGGGTETYEKDAGGAANPEGNGWQLTYSMYDALIAGVDFTVEAGGILRTTYTLNGSVPHLDIWADSTPDASPGGLVLGGGGARYMGDGGRNVELPVRDDISGGLLVDLTNGTYYDRGVNNGVADRLWGELAFVGDPADDDYLLWSFVGNPESALQIQESWSAVDQLPGDLNGDGVTDIQIYVGGQSLLEVVSGAAEMIVGDTPVTDAAVGGRDVVLETGLGTQEGHGNYLLVPGTPYDITGLFEFGPTQVDAYDSDPNTFTFQQGIPVDDLGGTPGADTLLSGQLVPEPVTMAGLMLGVGSLLGYVRKRR
jgi:hypothetical protein